MTVFGMWSLTETQHCLCHISFNSVQQLPPQAQTTIAQLIADMNSVLSEDYWSVVNNAAALLQTLIWVSMVSKPHKHT